MKKILPDKKLYWINAVKAICMICVYWAHSEAYCPVSKNITILPWIAPFYVNAFFIVSGYLFFYSLSRAEQRAVLHLVWHKGENIIFRLLIPTLIFSSLIYIPKFLFHSAGVSFRSYCYHVLGGVSFWFTSSLFVAQIIMLGLFGIFRKNMFVHLFVSLLLLTAVILLKDICPSPFPWYWKSGLVACFLFSLGGIYYRHEYLIDRFQRYIIISAFVIICLTALASKGSSVWLMMGCRFNFSGFVLMLTSSVLLFQLLKVIPYLPILDYIGKNSILFYFFSGVCPALCGVLWRKFLPVLSHYMLIFVAIGLELLWAWLVSHGINRFFPFLLDVRKLFPKRS